jgi:hypothetical protein
MEIVDVLVDEHDQDVDAELLHWLAARIDEADAGRRMQNRWVSYRPSA